jgi:hypothetical protein
LDLSQRLSSNRGDETMLNKRASKAALGLGIHIARSPQVARGVRLLVLRLVLQHHKNTAGEVARILFTEDKGKDSWLWLAFAQLKSGYSSTSESER